MEGFSLKPCQFQTLIKGNSSEPAKFVNDFGLWEEKMKQG